MPTAAGNADAGANGGDFGWVDRALASIGLTVDLVEDDLPDAFRFNAAAANGAVTVRRLVAELPRVLDAPGGDPWTAMGSDARLEATTPCGARVELAKLHGARTVSELTRMRAPANLSTSDFLKFSFANCMTTIAEAWDDTFVRGEFTHALFPDGTAKPMKQIDAAALPGPKAVAKVMHWVFRVDGLAQRELVSAYVCVPRGNDVTVLYVPVRGDLFPVANPLTSCNGPLRARLLFPCFDSLAKESDGSVRFDHFMSADVGGLLPRFFVNNGLGRSKFFTNSQEEAEHMHELLSGHGDGGAKFLAVKTSEPLAL